MKNIIFTIIFMCYISSCNNSSSNESPNGGQKNEETESIAFDTFSESWQFLTETGRIGDSCGSARFMEKTAEEMDSLIFDDLTESCPEQFEENPTVENMSSLKENLEIMLDLDFIGNCNNFTPNYEEASIHYQTVKKYLKAKNSEEIKIESREWPSCIDGSDGENYEYTQVIEFDNRYYGIYVSAEDTYFKPIKEE